MEDPSGFCEGQRFQEPTCVPLPDVCAPDELCAPACAKVLCGGLECGSCGPLTCSELPADGCDPKTQQFCPPGRKCVSSGSGLHSTRCTADVGTGLAGDACELAGASDTCAKGHFCFGTDVDGKNGTCVAYCAPDDSCAEGAVCGVDPPFCLPVCDPLAPDCPGGEACYPIASSFACVVDASGDMGKQNDPCGFINVCDPGLACVDAVFGGAGCSQDALGCCSTFCEFPGGACPNPDQTCVQWYDPAKLPADDPLLVIGICGVL